MKEPTFPGFSAECSLYMASSQYRLTAEGAYSSGGQAIIPQRSLWDWVKCGAAVVGAGAACKAGGATGVGIAGCVAAIAGATSVCGD